MPSSDGQTRCANVALWCGRLGKLAFETYSTSKVGNHQVSYAYRFGTDRLLWSIAHGELPGANVVHEGGPGRLTSVRSSVGQHIADW